MKLSSITVWPANVKPVGPLTDEEIERLTKTIQERYADSGCSGRPTRAWKYAPDQSTEEN